MTPFGLLLVGLIALPSGLPSWLNRLQPEKTYSVWLQAPRATDWSTTLERLGARQRGESKWLHAQSYEMPGWLVQRIAQTAPALQIRPVAKGKIQGRWNPTESLQQVLTYGLSEPQLRLIRMDKVHDEGYFGSGVIIGVLDTGFDSTHPAIRSLFDNGRIVARHDFNSGDHLRGTFGALPSPYGSAPAYINSLTAVQVSDSLTFLVFSTITRDSMMHFGGDNWRLWLQVIRTVGGSTYFDPPVPLGIATGKPIQPNLLAADDTSAFLVYQAKPTGSYDIFWTRLSRAGLLFPPINLSNDPTPSLDPLVLSRDTLVMVYWLDPDSGIYERVSYDGGQSFSSKTLVVSFPTPDPWPGRLEGIISDHFEAGSYLELIYDYRDSVYIYHRDWLSQTSIILPLGPGQDPTIAAEPMGMSFGTFAFRRDTTLWVGSIASEPSLVPESVPLMSAPFLRTPAIQWTGSGFQLVVSLGGALVRFQGSDFSSFVLQDTLGDYGADLPVFAKSQIFWRQRGDTDVRPDDMIPGHEGGPNYHGTKVLSVMAGFDQSNGMVGPALGAQFVLCKTEINKIHGQVFEFQIEEDFWIEGLEFAADRGAKIVNSSLGYRDWYTDADMDGITPLVSRAASMAADHGVLVVTAVGNLGSQGTFPDPVTGDTSLVAPADAFDVISVGAYEIDSTTGSLVPRSLFGPTADGRIKPEVIAPFTTYCGFMTTPQGDTLPWFYGYCGGTSFGTALVSGALAAIWEAHPSWTPRKLRRIVLNTAQRMTDIPGYPPAPDSNNVTGWGLFDAYAALHAEPPEVTGGFGDRLLDPYPNPVRFDRGEVLHIPFVLSHSTFTEIRIYTLDGREVYRKDLGILSPGRYHTGGGYFQDPTWDGTDQTGQPVQPGLYLILMNTGFNSSVKKVAVVR